jgi:endonuclease YncB( thermonuclease family)
MMIRRLGPSLLVSSGARGGAADAIVGLAFFALTVSAAFGPFSVAVAQQKNAYDESAATADSARSAIEPSCKLTRFAAGRVATVIDGRTFVLDDGRAIRLAAIEVAPLAAPPPGGAQPTPSNRADAISVGETARRTLALVEGRSVVLKTEEATLPPVDRYEYFVGYGFVEDGTAERSLQEALLASGQAQLSAHVEPAACRPALRTHEDAARRAALGLWAAPLYAVGDAATPAAIRVVEGEVVSVRESRGTIYVNFNRRWSEGFSAFIRKREAAKFAAAGLDLKHLEGRRVELRGYIEKRRGLLMAIERPEQIAIVKGRAPERP